MYSSSIASLAKHSSGHDANDVSGVSVSFVSPPNESANSSVLGRVPPSSGSSVFSGRQQQQQQRQQKRRDEITETKETANDSESEIAFDAQAWRNVPSVVTRSIFSMDKKLSLLLAHLTENKLQSVQVATEKNAKATRKQQQQQQQQQQVQNAQQEMSAPTNDAPATTTTTAPTKMLVTRISTDLLVTTEHANALTVSSMTSASIFGRHGPLSLVFSEDAGGNRRGEAEQSGERVLASNLCEFQMIVGLLPRTPAFLQLRAQQQQEQQQQQQQQQQPPALNTAATSTTQRVNAAATRANQWLRDIRLLDESAASATSHTKVSGATAANNNATSPTKQQSPSPNRSKAQQRTVAAFWKRDVATQFGDSEPAHAVDNFGEQEQHRQQDDNFEETATTKTSPLQQRVESLNRISQRIAHRGLVHRSWAAARRHSPFETKTEKAAEIERLQRCRWRNCIEEAKRARSSETNKQRVVHEGILEHVAEDEKTSVVKPIEQRQQQQPQPQPTQQKPAHAPSRATSLAATSNSPRYRSWLFRATGELVVLNSPQQPQSKQQQRKLAIAAWSPCSVAEQDFAVAHTKLLASDPPTSETRHFSFTQPSMAHPRSERILHETQEETFDGESKKENNDKTFLLRWCGFPSGGFGDKNQNNDNKPDDDATQHGTFVVVSRTPFAFATPLKLRVILFRFPSGLRSQHNNDRHATPTSKNTQSFCWKVTARVNGEVRGTAFVQPQRRRSFGNQQEPQTDENSDETFSKFFYSCSFDFSVFHGDQIAFEFERLKFQPKNIDDNNFTSTRPLSSKHGYGLNDSKQVRAVDFFTDADSPSFSPAHSSALLLDVWFAQFASR